MANEHRGELAVSVGGRDRILRFDLNALVEAQTALRAGSVDALLEAIGRADAAAVRTLLRIGLAHEDPDLTAAQVGAWEMRVGEMARAVQSALLLSWQGPRGTSPNRDGGPGEPGAGTRPSDSPTAPSD